MRDKENRRLYDRTYSKKAADNINDSYVIRQLRLSARYHNIKVIITPETIADKRIKIEERRKRKTSSILYCSNCDKTKEKKYFKGTRICSSCIRRKNYEKFGGTPYTKEIGIRQRKKVDLHKVELSDLYIKTLIKTNHNRYLPHVLKIKNKDITPEFVDVKRKEVLIKKLIENGKELNKNPSKENN